MCLYYQGKNTKSTKRDFADIKVRDMCGVSLSDLCHMFPVIAQTGPLSGQYLHLLSLPLQYDYVNKLGR